MLLGTSLEISDGSLNGSNDGRSDGTALEIDVGDEVAVIVGDSVGK